MPIRGNEDHNGLDCIGWANYLSVHLSDMLVTGIEEKFSVLCGSTKTNHPGQHQALPQQFNSCSNFNAWLPFLLEVFGHRGCFLRFVYSFFLVNVLLSQLSLARIVQGSVLLGSIFFHWLKKEAFLTDDTLKFWQLYVVCLVFVAVVSFLVCLSADGFYSMPQMFKPGQIRSFTFA